MVGFLIYLALSTLILVSYMTHNFNIKQIRDSVKDTEEQSAYFYDFVKNHYNAYISLGVVVLPNVGVIDLINANVLPKNFPRDLPFQAIVRRNSCNPDIYDVVYLTNNPTDLRDYLMRHDWSFAKDIVDPCRPNESGLKIDYARDGIGTVYGYNIGNNYTGNVIILTAPKQVGYMIFKLGWADVFPMFVYRSTSTTTDGEWRVGYNFSPFIKFERFSTVCPQSGINIDQQDYINFLGARQITTAWGFIPSTATICIPVLKSDFRENIVITAETHTALNSIYSNNLRIDDLSDVANYFTYPEEWGTNLLGIPFRARSIAVIVKSSLTNKYYFVFVGAVYNVAGQWNRTRDGFPVFTFDSNLGQIAHASLIRVGMSFREDETKTIETTSNSFPALGGNRPVPDDMIHRIVFNRNNVYWYIGYYDRHGNKRQGTNGKLAIVPFGRNY